MTRAEETMRESEPSRSLVSVITAVDPGRAEHLPEAYASLAAQQLPDGDEVRGRVQAFQDRIAAGSWGSIPTSPVLVDDDSARWDFEWLVQCDSVDPDAQAAVRALLPDDPRISFGASRPGGPGIARTMALARARGELVKVLDADDQLAEGALGRDIAACNTTKIGWSGSRVLDTHPDGTVTEHRGDLPTDGWVKSGLLGMYWRKHEWQGIRVHPATLCARRWLVVALGGWMALPASEDTGLLMALDAISDGWWHEDVGLHYRRWKPQMSASAEHVDPAEREARLALITERANALPGLCGGW